MLVPRLDLLRAAFDAIDRMAVLVDPDGTVVLASARWCKRVMERGELVCWVEGRNCFANDEAAGPYGGEVASTAQGLRRVLRGESPNFVSEYEGSSTDGPLRLRLSITPFEHAGRIWAVMMLDETPNEGATRHVQAALDAAQIGTVDWDVRSGLVTLDDRGRTHFQVDRSPVPIWQLSRRLHPVDRENLARQWRQGIATSNGRWAFECRLRPAPGGSEPWLLINLRFGAADAAQGGPLTASGTVQDVTDRRRSEAWVARFVSASPVVLYALRVTSAGLSYLWASENLSSLTGWTIEEASAPDWWHRNIHPDDYARVLDAQALPYSAPRQLLEFRFRRKNGTYFWVRDEKRLVRDALGSPVEVVGSWADVSERVALEEQLRQSQKMEALGLLAGGIAHDFNNLLTVISGNCSLIAPDLPSGSPQRVWLDEIADAGERAATLTGQLLTFGRRQVLAPRVIGVAAIVQQVHSMLRRLIGENILLTCRLSDPVGRIRVDPVQLEQVIVNVALNARDAMPAGGRLTIECDAVEVGPTFLAAHPDARPGRYARLTISDTGGGMTPAVRARAFEPFFTTKARGKGSGLGLSIVFGIVNQSGGYIDLESELGVGTRVVIHLPQVETLPDELPGPASLTGGTRGHETVLIAEDEETVRQVTRVALEQQGYKVLTAADGRGALTFVHPPEATIDLLLTDVMMPGMSGRQLVDALRREQPNLKVLFMSGYLADMLEQHALGDEPFIRKPFTAGELARKVRTVLDETAPRPSASP